MDSLHSLPGELRNAIYEEIAKDDYLCFGPAEHTIPTFLHQASPMFNAPDQIKAEYISIAVETSWVLETTVYDFDFTHVERYLSQMSDDNIKTFRTGEKPSLRRFIINLRLTPECPYLDPPYLGRWLERSRIGFKGAEIEFEYQVPVFYDDPSMIEDDSDRVSDYLWNYICSIGHFESEVEAMVMRSALEYPMERDLRQDRDAFARCYGDDKRTRAEALKEAVTDVQFEKEDFYFCM